MKTRAPFQGVRNIVRFNWHFFVIAAAVSILALILSTFLPSAAQWLVWLVVLAAMLGIAISLSVSFWVYDRSDLYELPWLRQLETPRRIGVINAGFDEVSDLLQVRFPDARFEIWDFHDPNRHTEVSLKRARRAYPPNTDTKSIKTSELPSESEALDQVSLMMAAHEIRDPAERRAFFREVHRVLRPGGQVWVTEHLRDLPNFLAYTLGFFHFYSKAEWRSVFADAGLDLIHEHKTTPFVSTFILEK
ncbi:MAG: class I SAM-dependent methyltransferase [Verrucomicrobiota bacterium]